MVFTAKTSKLPLLLLLVISIFNLIRFSSSYSEWQLVVGILFLVLLFLTLFLNYTFIIHPTAFVFFVRLHKLPVLTINTNSDYVEKIKFRRYGWEVKGAVIEVRKKLNMRIINFHPYEVYDELYRFATQHNIPVTKTKDYQILEK
ncbi:hypothetical protein [Alkalihalobacterium sp. APHAB7]|uniref:hypothetical protein n=1 Tax=Alkalihalobacterium sp. APHAB7 TaxID=3402081 RepID=UPI003AAC1DB3